MLQWHQVQYYYYSAFFLDQETIASKFLFVSHVRFDGKLTIHKRLNSPSLVPKKINCAKLNEKKKAAVVLLPMVIFFFFDKSQYKDFSIL